MTLLHEYVICTLLNVFLFFLLSFGVDRDSEDKRLATRQLDKERQRDFVIFKLRKAASRNGAIRIVDALPLCRRLEPLTAR